VGLYGAQGILNGIKSSATNGAAITKAIEGVDPEPDEPVYVLIASSMQAFGTEYGFLRPGQLAELSKTLSGAPGWFRIYHSSGLTVYELPPIS